MKYAFIGRYQAQFPVRSLCRVLGVSTSGYYAWRNRPLNSRVQSNQVLLQQIRVIHVQSRCTYGAVKTWKALVQQGVMCGKNRVANLRRQHGIEAKRRKRFKITMQSRQPHWAAPNLLDRVFQAARPNRKWVGDVTFVGTRSGWLYLAIMLDLYSRKIVGWAMSEHNNTDLVQQALYMAVKRRKPRKGLMHHSDQGATYTAAAYQQLLTKYCMQSSMSRAGNCFDNAVAESFFSTLKNELTHGASFQTRQQAKTAIFEYIEVFYNRQRLHQSIDYQSPTDFENMKTVA